MTEDQQKTGADPAGSADSSVDMDSINDEMQSMLAKMTELGDFLKEKEWTAIEFLYASIQFIRLGLVEDFFESQSEEEREAVSKRVAENYDQITETMNELTTESWVEDMLILFALLEEIHRTLVTASFQQQTQAEAESS